MPIHRSSPVQTARKVLLRRNEIAPVGVLCLFLVVVPLVLPIYNADFNVYYETGRSLRRTGTLDYAHSIFLDDTGDSNNQVNRFHSPPLVGLVVVPFTSWSKQAAGNIFVGFELLTYLVVFVVSLRSFSSSQTDRWVLLSLFLLCRFFYTSLQLGQLTFLALLVVVLTILMYEKQRPRITGALASFGTILKLPLGLLLLYFACKREYKIVRSSALSLAAFLLVSLGIFGVGLHSEYFTEVILETMGSTVLAYNNPGVTASIMRFFKPKGPFDWSLVEVPTYVGVPVLVASLGLLVYLYRTFTSHSRESILATRLEISMVVVASLLVFPIVWDHYYLLLLLPYFFTVKAIYENEAKGRLHLLVWAGSWALVSVPVLPLIRFSSQWLPEPGASQLAIIFLPSMPLWGGLTLFLLLTLLYRNCSDG